MKFTVKAISIAIAVLIVIVLYSGLYTLEEGYQYIKNANPGQVRVPLAPESRRDSSEMEAPISDLGE